MRKFFLKNYLFLIFLAILTIVSIWISRISPAPPQTNLIDLANAFLHSKVDLIPPIRVWNDYAIFNNTYFIYFGPFSGVLFIPFVFFFGINFPQQIIIPPISLIIFIGIYRISKNIGTTSTTALWLSTFFIFGTIYLMLSLTTISSYNVQIIGLLFIILSLLEFTGKSRPFLIGLLVALAGLTRAAYYPAILFFILEFLFKKNETWKIKKIKIAKLAIIPLLSIIIFCIYNYVRFGSILDTGYGYIPETYAPLIKAKEYGAFSLNHIAGNLYLFLFKSPDPVFYDNVSFVLKFPYLRASEWGMGIFFTSPVLIYLILAKLKNKYVLSSLITVAALLTPILIFYGTGIWQYGYRYALGIYPFLTIILASIFKEKVPLLAKCLIIYGILFGLLFMYSIFNIYPFKL